MHGQTEVCVSWRGNDEIVALLLTHGADANAPGGKYYQVDLEQLKDARKFVDAEEHYTHRNGSALWVASCNSKVEATRLLIEKGASGDIHPRVLTAAARRGATEAVCLFLPRTSRGIDWFDHEEETALQAASQEGHREIVNLLLEQEGGYIEIVRLLLEKAGDPNLYRESYADALQSASEHGHILIVQLLLEKGTNPNWREAECQGALQMWTGNGMQAPCEFRRGKGTSTMDIVRILLEKGADPNDPDEKRGKR
ncbi:ankyrin repeat-containing domain protein [Mycena leptocephala]|nr:ankyrin repeat-containing domain protein [Mycena leptocephala]